MFIDGRCNRLKNLVYLGIWKNLGRGCPFCVLLYCIFMTNFFIILPCPFPPCASMYMFCFECFENRNYSTICFGWFIVYSEHSFCIISAQVWLFYSKLDSFLKVYFNICVCLIWVRNSKNRLLFCYYYCSSLDPVLCLTFVL